MFNCRWKGKTINAYEISKSEITEKEIRIAAHNNELECICPDCGPKKLIYKHGDQIGAHFAHDKKDSNCAYSQFEADDKPLMRNIRNVLYSHFISKGYDVEQEVYLRNRKKFCHLLLKENGENIALQIAEESIPPEKIEALSQACSEIGYKLKWIIIGKVNAIQDNYDNHHIHRYLLNHSKNKDIIIIDKKAEKVAQTKIDNSSYIFFNINFAARLGKNFCFSAPLSQLTVKNGELTIDQFHEKYTQWIINKREIVNNRLDNVKSEVDQLYNSIEKSFKRLNSVANSSPSNSNNSDQNSGEAITEKIDYEKFKVGVKVYHDEFYYGEITDIIDSEEPSKMKVKIKFESENDLKQFSVINLTKSSRFKFI